MLETLRHAHPPFPCFDRRCVRCSAEGDGGEMVHLKLKFSNGEILDTPFVVKSPATAK